MHATSPLPVHTHILAWQPSNYPDGATEPSFCENDQTINGVEGNYIDAYSDAYMEGPGLFLKEELPCRVQLRRRAWTVQRQGRPRVPRLRSQHRPLRGVDAPRRRRRPAGSRHPHTFGRRRMATRTWDTITGAVRERGGRRPMLRRRGHPTGPLDQWVALDLDQGECEQDVRRRRSRGGQHAGHWLPKHGRCRLNRRLRPGLCDITRGGRIAFAAAFAAVPRRRPPPRLPRRLRHCPRPRRRLPATMEVEATSAPSPVA